MTFVPGPSRSRLARLVLGACCIVLALGLAIVPARASGPWEGVWATTYGEVHLRQDGVRVWGDYRRQAGVIEARTTGDGMTLRGTFLRGDGTWGWLSFTRTATGWDGMWRWNDIPEPGDASWDADAQISAAPPVLRHATGPGPFWPPTYAGRLSGRYASYAFGPGQSDPHVFGTLGPPLPDPASRGWYGSYDSDLSASGYMVSVAVDDTAGFDRAIIDLSFFAPVGGAQEAARRCPIEIHPAFCAELHARFGPDTSTRASMAVNVVGAVVNRGAVEIAFTLEGDVAPRLLVLNRQGVGGLTTPRMRIYHPQRGLDLAADTLDLPHPCDGGTCDPGRSGAAGHPQGPLASVSFLQAYLILPDGRAAAHAAAPLPAPAPDPAPAPQGNPPGSSSGERQIVNEDGIVLGSLELVQQAGGQITGQGWLVPSRALQGLAPQAVVATSDLVTPDAIDLRLSYTAGTPAPARLLLGRGTGPEGDALIGTLVRGDAWDLVTLPAAEEELYDLPGVGVYGPTYRLRNTDGNPAQLRQAPRSDAPVSAVIAGGATGINVLQCSPEIDSLSWEQAGPARRWQMLDAAWCEVIAGPQATGWIPGYFLDPILP